MVTRIGEIEESDRWATYAGWSTHVAWVHLRTDHSRLSKDLAAGAPQRVIAADRAAVVESRDKAGARRLVDLTV